MKLFLNLTSGARTGIGALVTPSVLVLAMLTGCSSPSISQPGLPHKAAATAPSQLSLTSQSSRTTHSSLARNAKDYRRDAAAHLYAQQSNKIFKGRLPPMLYAVGVLQIDIDKRGQVQGLHWQRAPRHAPEVMAEIEKMVRDAAPYPAPQHMAKVTYTDVWLWHQSGRFQLDTLTEGQD